jgi:hypothetical protein
MSLLPVIDPGAIKQHRIAVNYENNSRHVSAALAFAYGVKALAREPTNVSCTTPAYNRRTWWVTRASTRRIV